MVMLNRRQQRSQSCLKTILWFPLCPPVKQHNLGLLRVPLTCSGQAWRDQPALRIFELRTLISQGAIAPLSYIGPKSNIHTLRLQSIFIPKDSHSLNPYGMKEGLQKAFGSTVKNMKGESHEHISSNRV